MDRWRRHRHHTRRLVPLRRTYSFIVLWLEDQTRQHQTRNLYDRYSRYAGSPFTDTAAKWLYRRPYPGSVEVIGECDDRADLELGNWDICLKLSASKIANSKIAQ